MPAGRWPTLPARCCRAGPCWWWRAPATMAATASWRRASWPSAAIACGSGFVGERGRLKGDAAKAAARWSGPLEQASPERIGGEAVVIDALFGAGLDRPVEGLPRAMIEAMNAGGRAGRRGRSAERRQRHHWRGDGRRGRRPAHTVTFFRRKPGHLLLPGRLALRAAERRRHRHSRQRARRDQACDLRQRAGALGGVFPAAAAGRPQICARPCRGGVGRPVVHRSGAAGRARGAAGRGGACHHRAARAMRLPSMPRPTWRSWCGRWTARPNSRPSSPISGAMRSRSGPAAGSGPEMREMVRAALASEAAVVLDADALTSFADEPEALLAADRASAADAACCLTPHEGEFSRLFKVI